MALRAHPLACAADCPLLLAAEAAVAARVPGRAPGAWRGLVGLPACPSVEAGDFRTSTGLSAPAGHHAAAALRFLFITLANPTWKHAREDATREAAKAETKIRGVAGAADVCLTLAGRLGMLP